MAKKDPRVDAYIANAADFAKPILKHVRKIVHAGCPAVEETIKWGVPSFEYKGLLGGMAAFKRHCAFGFWKESLLAKSLPAPSREAMGSFGRITSLADLPSDARLIRLVKEAAALNEKGVKVPRAARLRRPAPRTPAFVMSALRRNEKALAVYRGFSPSHRREYLEWILEAKGEETRARRLKTTVEWLAQGKAQNWKYMKK